MSKNNPKKSSKTEPKKQGNVFDAFVKQMFGRIMVFVDFLWFYADKEFVDAIDLSIIRPAPTHYVGNVGRNVRWLFHR